MDLLLASDDFQIAGLPMHPLLVHAVVVLVPLTARALVLGTLWPAARTRLGIVTPLAAALLVVLVPITVAAGEALAEAVGTAPDVETHEGYGRMLLPWVVGMLVVAAAQWAWFRWGGRRGPDGARARPRSVTIALGALALAAAAGATGTVVLIGDSGARAVWGGLLG